MITAACVQMEPRVGRKAENVERSCELASRATADGADLVVLPELCNSGYVFESPADALRRLHERLVPR